MTDFIDRAKLEAEAEAHVPVLGDDEEMLTYSRRKHRELRRSSFLAGAAAYAALLDAETTEEWGTWSPRFGRFLPFTESKERVERHAAETGEEIGVRRVAVTPWLPSEGGES